eukprot:7205590-Prorocentrum_lima.AAC.1
MLIVDGTRWHAATPIKGFRLSLVFFNSNSLQKLPLHDWQQLEDLQFPCSSMRRHHGERPSTAALEVDKKTL